MEETTRLAPGTSLLNAKYRVEAFLGQGAFAQVYRVTHVGLDAPRAAKVLRQGMPGVGSTAYSDYRQRFQLEAQLGARVEHPHVIRVYDFEQDGDMLVLVMEYAPGGSLADKITASEQPSPKETARWLLDAARGLAALHEQDVIHRDVKPSNLLLDAQGRVKVADLGLAQVGGGQFSGRPELGSAVGIHPGTPNYFSPEHSGWEPLAPTSDVYSLGCTAFELLTGKVWKSVRRKVASTRDPQLQPSIPRWLDGIVMRMLREMPGLNLADAADPQKRYVDMESVVVALEAGARPPTEVNLRPDGKGDYMTLEDAVAELAPGGLIRLAAGEYRLAAPLLIEKPLRLVGVGWEQTTVSGDGVDYVLKATGAGTFAAEGITFRYTGEQGAYVVDVAAGEVALHHCRFTGGRRDTTRKFGGNGLYVHGATRGKVWECRADANQWHGIVIIERAQPTLENNTCRENKASGIAYFGNAAGIARQNQCMANKLQGIMVQGRAQPMLENNTCRENTQSGIVYLENAAGTARQNQCVANELDGISVNGQAQPTLENNTCRENKTSGITYFENAAGTARQNQCVANQSFGIEVQGQAQPTLENNTCQGSTQGIAYVENAGGTARQNQCVANQISGIGVSGQAQPTLENNTCRENTGSGIMYDNAGGGIACQNQCMANPIGISVNGQAQPTLENNTCRENKTSGIAYFKNAAGTARQNQCVANQFFGISVQGQAQPTLENNTCRENGSVGIAYSENAGGTARQNQCVANELDGISVNGQAQPTLENNTCRENKTSGITYFGSARGTARQNQCVANQFQGIIVRCQAQPTLENNTCRENTRYGIAYFENAAGTATGNVCMNNQLSGIYVAATAYPQLASNYCSINRQRDIRDDQW